MLAGCAVRLSVARPGDTNYCSEAETTCDKLVACCESFVAALCLHPTTFYFLVTGHKHALELKSYEVLFEAFPQFILQTYSIFLFGFGFTATGTTLGLPSNVLGPVIKILGVITSFVSTVHGVNTNIVDDNFPPPLSQRNILKCCIYTLPDLLMRLLIFPICWLLLSGYAVIVNIILTLIWMVIFLDVNKESSDSWQYRIFQILSINIAPQSTGRFQDGSSFEPGKLWILAKLLSNIVFFIVTIFLKLLLKLDTASTVVDTKRISVALPADYGVNICNQTSSYQEETYVNTQTLDYGFFVVIYICLVVSSFEIIFFFFNQNSWRRFLVGNLTDENFSADTTTREQNKIVTYTYNKKKMKFIKE